MSLPSVPPVARSRPLLPVSPASAGEAALAAIFPALAQLLGPEGFGALCAAAVARSSDPDAARDIPAGAAIHGLLVRRDTRTDDRIPSRLAADIAALEWAIHCVAGRATSHDLDRRATPRDLDAAGASPSPAPPSCDASLRGASPRDASTRDPIAPDEGWRAASLQPVRAFDIVPIAFRLENWVRRAHDGRRAPRLPMRGEQHVVVYARPAVSAHAAGEPAATHAPDADELPDPRAVELQPVWWFALTPELGALLARLALGVPVGAALREAVQHGWMPDEAAARGQLDAWLREGLFARVLPPEPASSPRA